MTPLDMQPVEKPREVYLRVCQQISETFAGDGFRFFKSRYPRARKCTDRYVCEIGFQTSRYNLSGKYVAATVHAGVDSKEAGQWLDQSDWPFGWTESLGGGQIGNLRKPFRGLIWNFAQPEARPALLDEVVGCIRETALPFFVRFSDFRALATELVDTEVPGIWPEKAVALCYWQLGRPAAEQCLVWWMRQYPTRLDHFRAERDRVLAGGIPKDVFGDEIPRLGAIAASLGIARGF